MNRFKKWLIPVALVCLLLASLVGCSNAPASLGEIFDPSGNPFANRFSDVKDIRTATYVVAASDSEHKYEADYFCNGTNDHVQIQAAIDAGDDALLLDGTFNIEVSLALDSYQTLRGCGRNTILTTTTANVDIITATGGSGTEKVGILIADLCVDGNAGGVANDVGILFTYVDYSKIVNVWSRDNGEDGIELATSDFDTIENCTLISNLNEGLYLNDCDYCGVIGNTSDGNTWDGISLSGGSAYNTITGNVCEGQTGYNGLYILGSSVHNTVSSNIFHNNVTGIYIEDASDNNNIIGNICTGNSAYGIYATESDRNVYDGNNLNGNTEYGMFLYICHENAITGNVSENNGRDGIYLDECDNNAVSGNLCNGNTWNGIQLEAAADWNSFTGNTCNENGYVGIHIYDSNSKLTVTGNTCYYNGYDGINIEYSYNVTVTGNTCSDNDYGGNTYSGIYIFGSDYVTVSGNECDENGLHGIYVYRGDHNLITGNICQDNNTGDGINITGAGINCDFNHIIANSCIANGAYGIQIVGGIDANSNRVIDNVLRNNTTAPFADAGTDTELASVTVPFSDGGDPQDSGYLIDANTEYARAWSFLDIDVQQVMRIKVYARAVPLEADAMRAEFVIYGGADNEAYTIHNGSIANHPSTSTNFAADDVIYWTITEAGVLALLGGDSVEVKVLHEDVGDGDIDTQAYFRTVTIEYV